MLSRDILLGVLTGCLASDARYEKLKVVAARCNVGTELRWSSKQARQVRTRWGGMLHRMAVEFNFGIL